MFPSRRKLKRVADPLNRCSDANIHPAQSVPQFVNGSEQAGLIRGGLAHPLKNL
jgi:hypothetical protein